MFSFAQIALSAVVGLVASLVVVIVYRRATNAPSRTWTEPLWLAVVVGLSILVWRTAGNTAALNDDPIPVVSPNDVLCPVLTYVGLGLYGGVRQVAGQPDWARVRALLTLVSLVVNVVTI